MITVNLLNGDGEEVLRRLKAGQGFRYQAKMINDRITEVTIRCQPSGDAIINLQTPGWRG